MAVLDVERVDMPVLTVQPQDLAVDVERDRSADDRFRPDLLNGVEVIAGEGSRPFVAPSSSASP